MKTLVRSVFSFIKLYRFLVSSSVSTSVLEYLIAFLPVLEVQTCILSHFSHPSVGSLLKEAKENSLITQPQVLGSLIFPAMRTRTYIEWLYYAV